MKTSLPPGIRVSLHSSVPTGFNGLVTIGILVLLFAGVCDLPAQVPQGINYQALAVNAAGEPIRNEQLTVKLTILSSLSPETIVWQEVHNSIGTNETGLFSVVLGNGTRQLASTVPLFSDINWSVPEMHLRTHITYQSTEHLMGTSRLLTVPYAFSAGDLSGSLKKLEVAGELTAMDEALFEVKNKNGQTVFAVYNEGVRIYVGNGSSKAVKGGFAIGSFDESKADTLNLLVVNKDSVRVYIYDDPLNKAVKGGFGIGGFDESKGITNDYMLVSPDSIRMYIDKSGTKAVKGGFGIGGFDESKGPGQNYLTVSSDSVRVYIDESVKKAVKGGFAIGSFDESKITGKRFLEVTTDSTRVYVTNQGAAGSVGGFAVKALEDKQDYFNISGVTAAETIDNESRIMWYPKKSALIAGEIWVPHPDSVGQYSLSMGYRNIANGKWSQAMGYQSIARGELSTAIGYEAVADSSSFAFGTGTRATGYNSFAFGSRGVDATGNVLTTRTEATGKHSFAFGLGSKSSGIGSFVMGTNCESTGNFSNAMGFNSKAFGLNSTSIGVNNTSSGEVSFTLGSGNQATVQYAFAFGANNTASGIASVAFGLNNVSSGLQSFVGGNNNQASGYASIAMGSNNTVTGDGGFAVGNGNNCSAVYAVAFGASNTASGDRSFATGFQTIAGSNSSVAMGYQSRANGNYSVAIGQQDTAIGQASLATGNRTSARGYYSVAMGYSNTVGTYAGLAIGRFNSSTGGNATGWSDADPLFIAGNGTSAAIRRDAMVLYKSGDMKLSGNFYPSADNTKSLGLSGNRWTAVYAVNGTIQTSDARLKRSVAPLSHGLNELLKLNPVSFQWVGDESGKVNLGLIADEVLEVIPEIVDVGTDPEKLLGLNYSSVVPILINGIKEQQSQIEELAQKNRELEDRLLILLERISEIERKMEKNSEK